jgi:hypothetical protein
MRDEKPSNILLRVCVMASERSQVIQEAFLEFAIYLGCRIEDVQLREYTREMLEENIATADVVYALQQIRKQPNRKMRGIALPAEVIQFLRPQLSDDDVANSIAAKIQYCYKHFGYNNADAAKAHMGVQAWQVVHESGGWAQMCAGATEEGKRTEYAQLRDLARSVLRRDVQTQRMAQLEARRLQPASILSEPRLTPVQMAENRRRAAELVGSVFRPHPKARVPI